MLLLVPLCSVAQKPLKVRYTTSGIFSLGIRIPFSFTNSPDGLNIGQGLGAEARIQLGNHYNTEWYGEYLRGKYGDDAIRSNMHLGGSFLLYPQSKLRRVQPFIFAGPDADFEKIHDELDATNAASRWNVAAHGGLGMHINVTWRSDITLNAGYMLHFGKKIETMDLSDQLIFVSTGSGVDGHLLLTVSMNFKMVDLWKKIRW